MRGKKIIFWMGMIVLLVGSVWGGYRGYDYWRYRQGKMVVIYGEQKRGVSRSLCKWHLDIYTSFKADGELV